MSDSTIILGIDPGSINTGYGLIKVQGSEIHVAHHGVLKVDSKKDIFHRIKLINAKVKELLEVFKPQAMAVEKIFFGKNVKSLIRLGEARGAAIVAAVNLSIPIYEYSALEVKQAVVGYGKASKEQVQKMIQTLFRLQNLPEQNSADALAIALCHTQVARFRERISHL